MMRTARPLLWPLVPAYRLALALREIELRTGLKPVRRLRRPVVSIGNLSAGGAGKTPLTITLAKALAARAVHVDVLSRGYGRRRSALPLLVDASGTAEEFGDEPLVIAREASVPVYVADERYQAGLLAEVDAEEPAVLKGHGLSRAANAEKTPTALAPEDAVLQVHLLDDGFQHRQLHRDVDILLLSRADLDDHLLPAGKLREALRAAERAHVIAIPADEADIEAEFRSRGWKAEIWRVRRRMEIPLLGGPVAAFCGIARPTQFFEGLEREGLQLAARVAFPDHHRYSAAELDRFVAAARKFGAVALLTTEKDRARLGAMAPGPIAGLPMRTVGLRAEIEREDAAVGWLMRRLEEKIGA